MPLGTEPPGANNHVRRNLIEFTAVSFGQPSRFGIDNLAPVLIGCLTSLVRLQGRSAAAEDGVPLMSAPYCSIDIACSLQTLIADSVRIFSKNRFIKKNRNFLPL